MSASSSIAELLGSPQVVVGFGATTLVLLATTFFYLKNNEGSSDGGAASTSSALEKVEELDSEKYPGGYLTIYYGSQTGTAQMFAKQIASESESRGFHTRVVDLQDVVDNEDQRSISDIATLDASHNNIDVVNDDDGSLIRATLAHPHYREGNAMEGRSRAIFLVATYGEGEPTDNAQQFVEMMKSKSGIRDIYKLEDSPGLISVDSCVRMGVEVDEDGEEEKKNDSGSSLSNDMVLDRSFLRDLDFAVFGLGNKQYEHYNNMSRFMDASLAKCGASRIAPLGLGDDDDDLEGDFENWKDNVLWPALTEKFVKGGAADALAAARKDNDVLELPECPYEVEYLKDGASKKIDLDMIQTSSKHYVQAMDCPIVASRELRDPSDPGSTVHMEIDISKHMSSLKYQTADNLGILPKNDSALVELVAKSLGFDLNQLFHLFPSAEESATKHTLPFPTPCTVRDCLERYCDLSGSPRRSDLKQLAPYARDEMDRKALLRMSSKEGKSEYKEKIVEAHVGIGDIVTRLCPSIVCPLEHFIMVCPRLQPRYYTISSSSTVHPKTIHITYALLESEKKNGGKFTGLCSGHLSSLSKGDMVRVFVRDSTFRLPKQPERPIIMIGPGTGIAPMRAILQERSYERKSIGDAQGPNILYFGCKNRTSDYIYRDELEAFSDEGTITELHLAFSREQAEKVYVQHLLAQRGAETWKLIDDGKASIFVCGAVKMGADVDHTLQDIIAQHGGMSREKAKAYLGKLQTAGRFVQELWS